MKIVIDLPPKVLSPNARPHFRVKSKATREYREHCKEESMVACFDYGIKSPFKNAVVGIKHYNKTARVIDRDNILASLKAAWDGFTDSGVWVDDRDVTFLPVVRSKDSTNPRVEVTIYKMSRPAWDRFVESLTPGNVI